MGQIIYDNSEGFILMEGKVRMPYGFLHTQ